MSNFFKRERKEKLKRGFGLFLSAVMVLNTLPFDQTTVSASEEQKTEIYSMETSEEDGGTKVPETDVEEPVQEETVQEETAKEEETTKECLTQEQQTEEEPEKEETSTEWRTEEKQTEEQTTQEASEEIISEEMTETEEIISEEEHVQDNLGASLYTTYRDCDKNGQNWEQK